jgi:hypothetical protein
MAENWHCRTGFDGSLSYQLSAMSAKLFMRDREKSIYGLM